MIIALIGNQNSGKTTLFNRLTGSNQKVGNFPGVTVEKKEASLRGHAGVTVVDLPGIYSLSPYSEEERVTRDFLVDEKPDVLINIVDATQIERSLYLSLQLIEMNLPIVLALNMMDEIRARGHHVHLDKLREGLGVPVVPISAGQCEGMEELIDCSLLSAEKHLLPLSPDLCSGPAHRTIHAIMVFIEDHALHTGLSPRYAAVKLAERDTLIQQRLGLNENEKESCEHLIREMEDALGTDHLAALADMRYAYIDRICQEAFHPDEGQDDPRTRKLDGVLLSKAGAIPIFLLSMLLLFGISFGPPGRWLSDLFSEGIRAFTLRVAELLRLSAVHPVLSSLLTDGILAGVGSVLSFLPLIALMFFLLSILEDSGYMARVAFIMDVWMRRIGLSGASIVPLLMGFGCTVPAIMASRTLAGKRDRLLTIFLIPFMSCSAKVPIYAALSLAFFPRGGVFVMLGLYLLGVLMAVLIGLILKKSRFKEEAMPFLMELPPYRFPSPFSVMRNLWDKVKGFMTRAFTLILFVSLLIWFLRSFNTRLAWIENADESMLAAISRFLLPLFRPLGIDDWRIPAALVSGFTAKEAVVSTLAVMTRVGVENLAPALQQIFSPASALAFLVFVLIYTPCVAAISCAKMELKRWSLTSLMVVGQILLAWLCAFLCYRLAIFFSI